jgi:hypothetical protein
MAIASAAHLVDARGMPNDPRIATMLEFLDHAFNKVSWHGPNLASSIRGIDYRAAARRMGGRRSIWEQVLHAAYWKRIVLNKLTVTERFPRAGSNWPRLPDPITARGWKEDVALLHDIHAQLRAAVESLDPRRLEDPKLRRMVDGAALHDIYHTGQIRLLRRMFREAAPGRERRTNRSGTVV